MEVFQVAIETEQVGTVIIEEGKAVTVGDETYYSDGLLQIATVLTNEGVITNNGILINSEDGSNI